MGWWGRSACGRARGQVVAVPFADGEKESLVKRFTRVAKWSGSQLQIESEWPDGACGREDRR